MFEEIMKKAARMKEKMEEVQAKLAQDTHEGFAGGDQVRATIDGRGRMVGLELDAGLLGENKAIIEDLVVAAVNAAREAQQRCYKEAMMSVSQELGFPASMPFPE